jgi:diacylglycerol kinase family enzyme
VRLALLVNPNASRVDEERVAAVEAVLRPVVTVRTERAGHATELARELPQDVDGLVVFSGDGGYNEALNGLARDVPVGFLPGGGTSVLPRALGLPRDPVAAARRVAAGRTRRISLGRVNGRRFAFSAGVGLDAEIVRRVDSLGRRSDGTRPGDAAFAATLARLLAERRLHLDPELEAAGHGRAAFALVCNDAVYTYAGPLALRVARGGRFEGGLELVAPVSVTPRRLARLVAYLAGAPAPGWLLRGRDLDRLELDCDRSLPLQADGEDLGDVEHASFECERGAVAVLV